MATNGEIAAVVVGSMVVVTVGGLAVAAIAIAANGGLELDLTPAERLAGRAADRVLENVQLSPHFSLGELTVSAAGARLGLENVPGPAAIANLRRLALEVLEPLRLHGASPMRITSGYRSSAVNAAVDGSSSSRHQTGEAADFEPTKGNSEFFFQRVRRFVPDLPIDQLILYRKRGHIHVGMRGDSPRRMVGIDHENGGRIEWLQT